MIITKIAFVPAYEIHFLVQVDSHIFFHLVGQYFLGSVDTVIKQVYDFLRNRSLSCDECLFSTWTATDHLIQDILCLLYTSKAEIEAKMNELKAEWIK